MVRWCVVPCPCVACLAVAWRACAVPIRRLHYLAFNATLQASFVRIKELLEEMVDPSDPYLDEIDYASAGLIKTKMHRMFHYHSVE